MCFDHGILASFGIAHEHLATDKVFALLPIVYHVKATTVRFTAQPVQPGIINLTVHGGEHSSYDRVAFVDVLLCSEAYTGGLDMVHNWKERKYFVSGKVFMSYTKGGENAMVETQRSSERYFQRPDNNHAHVDSARRSLNGTGGTFKGGKKSGRLNCELGGSWLSPQLELNDVGFLLQTDKISQWSWMSYRVPVPSGIFRSQGYWAGQNLGWDFDWKSTSKSYWTELNLEFKNFWWLGTGIQINDRSISNADLRGGPAMHYPSNTSYWLWASTDRRKKLQVNVNPQWTFGRENYLRTTDIDLNFTYRS